MSCAESADELTEDQARLVQDKMQVVERARKLQEQLAQVKSEIHTMDLAMIRAGFCRPVGACW